jgi:hypothetical protein
LILASGWARRGRTLQVRLTLSDGSRGEVFTVTWEYIRCSAAYYTRFTQDGYADAVECVPCPKGGDCEPRNATAIVKLADVVAQEDWWASESSSGRTFYECPIKGSCLSPHSAVNATSVDVAPRALCAPGYAGVLCSACDKDYFPQYGRCAPCLSKASPVSYVASFALPTIVVVLFGLLFGLRSMMPRGMMKVGLTMVQIIAAANSAYSIPWPNAFGSFMDVMKLFLVVRVVV